MRIAIVGGVPDSLVLFRGPLIARLVSLGHDVLAMAGFEDERITRELAALGARFATYPVSRLGIGPVADADTCRALCRRFRDERLDRVLAYTAKPIIWGGIAARLAGVPRFDAMITGLGVQFVDTARGRVLGAILSPLYRLSLSKARTVIFQNEENRRVFIDRGLVPAARTRRVHGSGVDLHAYPPAPPTHGPPVFLTVSRLLAAKGLRELAEAARIVRARHPDVRVVLAGRAESGRGAVPPQEVDAWVRAGDIEYLGELADVRPALRECTVYVLPSYYGEGVPRTILEAMASGRPVLTTDNVGCRDAVEHGGNGLVVAPRDAPALADGMRWFLEHPERHAPMARRGLEIARERYDVDKVNDELLRILGLADEA